MGKSLKITFLEEAQVDRVAGILAKAFNGTAAKKKKDLAPSLSDAPDKPITFIAAVNDNVVGVIRCLPYPRKEDQMPGACLFALAVDKPFRGQGIGRALIQHAEKYISKEIMEGEKGFISLADHRKKDNPDSVLYAKQGYQHYGTEAKPKLDEEGMPLMYKYVNTKSAQKKKAAASITSS